MERNVVDGGSLMAHPIPALRMYLVVLTQLWKRRPLGGGPTTDQQVGSLGTAGRGCADVHDFVQFCDRYGERAFRFPLLLQRWLRERPLMWGWMGAKSYPNQAGLSGGVCSLVPPGLFRRRY